MNITEMDHKIVISIIMAAHNEELYIDQAIKSIQNQTFQDWELIVVDDGSTDLTHKICAKYQSQDYRIKILTNEVCLGLPKSLNLGIKKAQGDYIARADADDINHPHRLEKQYIHMEQHPQIDVLGTGAWLLDKKDNRTNCVSLPTKHKDIIALPFLKTYFFHPSVIMRRNFFEKAGVYNETFIRVQDQELWLRGIRLGCCYANLTEPLIEYKTDGYVRSFKSILQNTISTIKIGSMYKIRGYKIHTLKLFLYLIMIKFSLYKPKTFRK